VPRARAVAAPDPFCPVHDAIAVLQGKWTLQIVHALMGGPMGFNELARAVGGCNPSTLAQRLDTLVRLDVLARKVEASTPPRTLYSVTEAGAALQPVVGAIEQWGRRYLRKARVQRVRRAARVAKESRAS
jgi:DNA-binding HxlR family transcriptional regulator